MRDSGWRQELAWFVQFCACRKATKIIWRIDVGYFLTQDRAQKLFPYPYVNNRFAGTLSWSF